MTISEILAHRFSTMGDAPAVSAGNEEISYRQLDALTSGAAEVLDRLRVPVGTTVGITGDRSIEQIALLVAIVRAGRAFCFLDHRSPPTWNRDVIARAGITHVIGHGPLDVGGPVQWVRPDALLGVTPRAPAVAVSPDHAVYVNFSSGTTGAPKVIACTHRGVVAFCHEPAHLPISRNTRLIYSAPLTFDGSQMEIWLPLLNGGCVVVNTQRHLTAEVLRTLALRDRANMLWVTSSLLNTLVDIDAGCLDGIEYVITGGEVLSVVHLAAIYRANPAITVFAAYGPTETTIITTLFPIPRSYDFTQPMPIGRPIATARLTIVRDGRVCGDDEIGELVIAGEGVAIGYLGDPVRTAEKFRAVDIDGVSMRGYWTGDLVSRDRTGLYHFHGRIDDQLKIRGHRVLLSEIADAFAGHPGIRSCAVIAIDSPSGRQLALCYVPTDAPADRAALVEFAEARLPEFMVPRIAVAVEALPLTPSGKLDRKAVAALVERHALEQPLDHGEGTAALLRRLAGLPGWRLEQSFFDAGGDSLGAIRLVANIARFVGERGDLLRQLYRDPRLGALAALLPPEISGADANVENEVVDADAPIPLAPALLSMVYPEVFHGDSTHNNVVYMFRPGELGVGVDLARLASKLIEHVPLAGRRVVEMDDGYALVRAQDGIGIDDDPTEYPDAQRCVAAQLARPISLFGGPLVTLIRCRVGGVLHHGVRFHHIIGDHVGQTELLLAIVGLARGERVAVSSDAGFARANRRLIDRADAQRDTSLAFWRNQALAPPVIDEPLIAAATEPIVRRRRLVGEWRDGTPSGQLLRSLAATAYALERVFDAREPLVYVLFSHREDGRGVGFQTSLAPIALTSDRVAEGRPLAALLDALLATRDHCAIGLEEILLASGIDASRVPFLFNFVDFNQDAYAWWTDHIVEAPCEPCKTLLDVTVSRAGDILDVTVTTRLAAVRAEAVLDLLEATLR